MGKNPLMAVLAVEGKKVPACSAGHDLYGKWNSLSNSFQNKSEISCISLPGAAQIFWHPIPRQLICPDDTLSFLKQKPVRTGPFCLRGIWQTSGRLLADTSLHVFFPAVHGEQKKAQATRLFPHLSGTSLWHVRLAKKGGAGVRECALPLCPAQNVVEQ